MLVLFWLNKNDYDYDDDELLVIAFCLKLFRLFYCDDDIMEYDYDRNIRRESDLKKFGRVSLSKFVYLTKNHLTCSTIYFERD